MAKYRQMLEGYKKGSLATNDAQTFIDWDKLVSNNPGSGNTNVVMWFIQFVKLKITISNV
ncbi:TPA: hypothetical protein JD334_00200 [Citrobacter freundii]|nr:hypothetical protein [Citrobacter freundii]